MKIRSKLFVISLAGIVGLVVVTGIAVTGLFGFQAAAATQERSRELTFQAIDAVKDAEIAFKTQVQEWKNVLIRGGDPAAFDKYLQQFGDQEAATQARLAQTASLLGQLDNPDDKGATEKLMTDHLALGENYRRALASYDKNSPRATQVVDQLVKGMDRATADGMVALVHSIQEHKVAVDASIVKKLDSQVVSLEVSLAVAGGLTVFLLLLVGWGLGGQLTRPILLVSGALANLSRGDLSVRLTLKAKDEMGAMGQRLNEFLGSLETSLTQVRTEVQSGTLGTSRLMDSFDLSGRATREIHEKADQVMVAIRTQSEALGVVTRTVESITQTIDAQDQIIETQSSVLGESSASIHEMIANIQSIKTNLGTSSAEFQALQRAVDQGNGHLGALKETIQFLSAQSDSVFEANETILNLASQTNLLAMNAAIEAAHAGEAGRGFSVVADEIRKLAEQSNQQSKIIQETLGRFHQSIEAAVHVSQETGTAFTTIVQSVGTVTHLENEIKNAVEEQAAGSSHVLESLNRMSQITDQVHQGSEGILAESAAIHQGIDGLVQVSDSVRTAASQVADEVTRLKAQADANAVLIRETQEGMGRTEASIAVFHFSGRNAL